MVANPGLIVADEPTGDLDRDSSARILGLLQQLSHVHGKTIGMVTHDAQAAAASHRTLHLVKGRLAEDEELATPASSSNTPAFPQS